MKAAVLREVGRPLEIENVAIGKPGPREVLIRAAATGVCHSDLHFVEGHYPTPMPTVLGHECAGVVEQVGSEVHGLAPGDHVVTCLSAFCGHCEFCVGGHLSLCNEPDTRRAKEAEPRLGTAEAPMAQFLNLSAFAEQLLVHENACVKIRRDMPLDRAALLGCATITAYGSVVRTAEVRPGQSVAVIGCGGVGLATLNAAQIAGAGRIVAIDRVAEKEALARDFGATDFIDASEGDVWKKVLGLTDGGVDHAFEAIGLADTASDAFRMLRRRGIATVIGMIPVGQKVTLNGYELLQEKQLRGSMMGSNQFPLDIPRLVDFYMNGRLKLDELISRRIRLDEVNEAFAEMKKGQIARSVITFE
ncbi:Zn-dependent alcohol dehydrogenase [Aurantiacibacter luteus]|uniref:Alcohol dehydrogenase n=1 Tax=Aurantiacibacter luteus TaxID=1581420 RepID=A0A0G9MXG3_9SPHN|nr:Zn-dependent alcohol dehydrogenase [Aurantiacibacter luteus]KLE33958.1 alcohol dehydrogenase [Aurantiacibacter luteus]